ncbi:NUDIX domain-containing protein [Nocardia sp. NPDC050435]|uniref:NUDIX hydrolase n=1 Tax=Nocardia sp. NPDC050435 TaxID=3155040 RepID=UPI0033F74A54
MHLLLTDDRGRILFGQREGTGFEDGAWHVPSGHLEEGESVVAALIREAAEEVGVEIAADDVEFSHIMHNASGRMAFFFTVRRWEGVPANREPDKCAGLEWFFPAELPEHMIDYCREALATIGDGRDFSLYGW